MPIRIKDDLPAIRELRRENIFVMGTKRSDHQDIRPLEIAILNLMPEKEKTELQLLRRLSNTPLQLNIDLLHPASHESKTTPKTHLDTFYTSFSAVKDKKYDGLIITGAPIEHLPFEEVTYWNEMKEVMDWAQHNVFSTLYICWGAQAGLFHHYGIDKQPLGYKQFGVYKHHLNDDRCPLTRGFDHEFWAPHSRHTTIRREDVKAVDELDIISESDEAGVYIVISKDNKHVFITGHSEYSSLTLKDEFERDKRVQLPENYFPDNDPDKVPRVNWSAHSNLLYSNWINHYVYQRTPFRLDDIK
jgi:homoserine O-succinyltransferase